MLVLMPTGKDSKVREDYGNKLREHNLEPLVVRYGASEEETLQRARAAYDASRAVLLLGGNDVNPRRYGEEPGELTKEMDDNRDHLDLTVLDWAYADRKPILGICRGAQMMAVHRGKKLMQHIPAYLPETDERHSKELVPQTTASLTKNRALLTTGSRIADIVGTYSLDIMCAHHQSLRQDNTNHLHVTARTARGVPECWEGSDLAHFCIGVQFHPEVMSGPTDGLFRAFYEAAWQYATQHKSVS